MTKREFKFGNGDSVSEIVTGFKGIITGSVYYLTGCNQYLVVPVCKEDGTKQDGTWYDEGRLVLIKKDAVPSIDVEAVDSGCDASPNRNN